MHRERKRERERERNCGDYRWSKRARQTDRTAGTKCNQMTAHRFQTSGRHPTSPASLVGFQTNRLTVSALEALLLTQVTKQKKLFSFSVHKISHTSGAHTQQLYIHISNR